MKIPALLVCLPLSALLVCGCGDGRPKRVQVTGKVTLNGEPLPGAIVAFQPVETNEEDFQRPANGTTDEAGNFTLGTYGQDDGVPVGKYKVAVQKRELVGELPESYEAEYAASAPLKYRWITPKSLSDPATSGLEAEVTSSGLEPEVLALTREGEPEIEQTGPQRSFNEP